MPKTKLTAAAVPRLKVPEKGQIDYFDAAYPALALRVSASGVRSWTYFGRVHGKLRRATLGRYPSMTLAAARVAAGAQAEAMQAGVDPVRAKQEKKRDAVRARLNTFAAVADEWLRRDQAGNRRVDEVRRVLDKDAMPIWEDWVFSEITRRDIAELLDTIADRGAVTMARRTHSYLHRLFRWAVGRGIIPHNPMQDLPKPGAETSRDRVLSDDELRRVWLAAEQIGYPFGSAVQLLILTGARRDEIGTLRWDEIDDTTIKLERARTKNGEPHTIPLSPLAAQILDGLPRIVSSEDGKESKPGYVFTTNAKTPVSGWSRAKLVLDRKAAGDGDQLPPWRFHDLRRTLATGLQRLGVQLVVIEAVLGHTGGSRAGIVGVYQRHSYNTETRHALRKWAALLSSIVAGQEAAKVTPIRQRK